MNKPKIKFLSPFPFFSVSLYLEKLVSEQLESDETHASVASRTPSKGNTFIMEQQKDATSGRLCARSIPTICGIHNQDAWITVSNQITIWSNCWNVAWQFMIHGVEQPGQSQIRCCYDCQRNTPHFGHVRHWGYPLSCVHQNQGEPFNDINQGRDSSVWRGELKGLIPAVW